MAREHTLRQGQLQRGIVLEYLTIGWNLVEGIVAIASGAVAASVALIGFGIDSFIEVGSGGILLWRLRSERRGANAMLVERRALRLVGIGFLLLAAYVAADSLKSLVRREAPEHSVAGICIAVLSLIVMPWLARQKRAAAGNLSSLACGFAPDLAVRLSLGHPAGRLAAECHPGLVVGQVPKARCQMLTAKC